MMLNNFSSKIRGVRRTILIYHFFNLTRVHTKNDNNNKANIGNRQLALSVLTCYQQQ